MKRAKLYLPEGEDMFTVNEALALVVNAGLDPIDVVDVFVEVATDETGAEYHPEGGAVTVKPRTSDKGLIALYLAAEDFPVLCKKLGIEPRNPWRTAQAYTGTEEQNRTYLITAEDLARYAEDGGLEVVTAQSERQGESPPAQVVADTSPDAAPAKDEGRQESSAATWQDKIREVADELHRNDLLAGAWSSDKDMSERLAAEAIKRKIRGPRGQLTAGNILREALQGGRWKRPEN